MSLAQRTLTSTGWNLFVNLATYTIFFLRSVLLARWLPVETFGVYGYAEAIVNVSVTLAVFGMGQAFLHRAPETEDEEAAASTHFTLTLIFSSAWLLIIVAAAMLVASGPVRIALVFLAISTFGLQLTQTPQLILTRRVVHRRLALARLLSTAISAALTLLLAWRGANLWALLATPFSNLVLTLISFYVWKPIWRPRLSWPRDVVSYFLSFGSRTFMVGLLSTALQQIDDVWTGSYLGEKALGFYSRAYRFALYPSMILAIPISNVILGTYAELKGDRYRLSRAFFQTNALLLRTGFFFGGLLALVAPELIRLLIGPKWLPMLDAFRLMLAMTLLDPIRKTVSGLMVVMGRPGEVVRVQMLQMLVLLGGLLLLVPRWGITGVAVAVNTMVVTGLSIWLWQARRLVDYSLLKLFAAPSAAVLAGLLSARSLIVDTNLFAGDWQTGVVKLLVFSFIYGLVMLLLERQQMFAFAATVYRTLRHSPRSS